MKNNKGMTLIETIIALLILSTASIIMVTGFVTAFRVFSDSEQYKNNTNNEETALINESQKDTNIDVDPIDATYSITLKQGQSPIEVNGVYKKAKSKTDDGVTLSTFETDTTDDTKKAKNVYNNYLNMMESLKKYLKDNCHIYATSSYKMNDEEIKQYISEWLKKTKKIDVDPFEIITNMPKLYSLVYPNVKVNDLGEEIKKINTHFDAEKYCYITPCLFMNQDTTYTDFIGSDGYKNIFILLGDKAKKGDRPNKIYALYDNNSSKEDVDVWWVPEQEVSTDVLENKTYAQFYNEIKNNSSWHRIETTKR